MELRQIRYFVRLAECLSFSEAARSLCITQSTLSQQIKQLENEFDTLLFERTKPQRSPHRSGPRALACRTQSNLRGRRLPITHRRSLRHEMRHTQHRSHLLLQPDTYRKHRHIHENVSRHKTQRALQTDVGADGSPATTRSGFRTRLPTAATRRGSGITHPFPELSGSHSAAPPIRWPRTHACRSTTCNPTTSRSPPEDSRHATHSTAWHHTS